MAGAQEPDPVSTKQQRIAALTKQSPQLGFTSLNHHLDLIWLVEAYNRTRKDGAPGVDGQTDNDYGLTLLDNLESLLDRAKSGAYFAPPVRRVHIPKGTGKQTRPLGIPTLEDKILQRAVVMALEPIYEQDFLDCSYGFRPGRSAHAALYALRQQVMDLRGCWLVEVDIRKFFETLDHAHLRNLLRQRVRDGVLLRLIDKWLKAGVLEDGNVSYPEAGAPQGGVISPLLSNVYLHYVLDVLPKRFGKYGLTIHPDKTRLVPFGRPSRYPRRPDQETETQPGSFDFLGFTHYWSRSRKGNWVVKQKTAGSRFHRAVKRIGEWFRLNRHLPVREQFQAFTQKLRGHYAYYGGVVGNVRCLHRFRYEAVRLWQKWLSRRKRRGQFSWERLNRLLKAFPLPQLPQSSWRVSPSAASP